MRLTNFRLFMSFAAILILPAIITFRLLYIQVLNHSRFERLASIQVSEKKVKNSERGLIYDRNMEPLAINVNTLSFAANPRQISDPAVFAKKLAARAGIPENLIIDRIKSKRNSFFVWLKRQALSENADSFKDMEIDGLIVVPEQRRYYPYGALTAKAIGVTDIDGKGLSAVERVHDRFAVLTKTVENYKKYGKDRKIKISPENISGKINIVTTIDAKLQYIAAKEVEETAKKYRAKNAFALIEDPSNGEILALACWPSFNPNEYAFSKDDLNIPVLQEVYEPGSTFKIVTAAAALSEGIIKKNNVIYCENGSYKYADMEINDHEKYGYLTFDGIFAYSSNIGFAKTAISLGKYRLYRWIRQFGFGNYTGMNVPGEQRGLLFPPTDRKWTLATSPTVSYGQGIGVTALQVINAYAAVANGGKMHETTLVKKIIDDGKHEIASFHPRIIRDVVTPEVAETLKQMLSNVVEYGTGRLAAVNGYKVCGKTGTAQKVDPATRKYGNKYITSFCGFLPMENPKIVIYVVVDEPKTNYWASDVACPAFARIAEQAMNYMSIPKTGQKYEFTKLSR